MLHEFLIKNRFVNAVTGYYSGYGFSVQVIDKNNLVIRETELEEYHTVYEGDHSGAIEYLSQALDL